MVRAIHNADLQDSYKRIITDLQKVKTDIQEKQLMIGAAILLADEIITEQLFLDDTNPNRLTAEYLAQFLKTRAESSVENRALELTIDWITINKNKFSDDTIHECYGFIEDDAVYIIRSVFNKLMTDNGFSDRSVLSRWAENDLINVYIEPKTGKTRHNVRKMRDGDRTNYISLKLDSDELVQDEQNILPFKNM